MPRTRPKRRLSLAPKLLAGSLIGKIARRAFFLAMERARLCCKLLKVKAPLKIRACWNRTCAVMGHNLLDTFLWHVQRQATIHVVRPPDPPQ